MIRDYLNGLPRNTAAVSLPAEAVSPLCPALPILENMTGACSPPVAAHASPPTLSDVFETAHTLPLIRRWQLADWLRECLRSFCDAEGGGSPQLLSAVQLVEVSLVGVLFILVDLFFEKCMY
jgi:hypothetical protein